MVTAIRALRLTEYLKTTFNTGFQPTEAVANSIRILIPLVAPLGYCCSLRLRGFLGARTGVSSPSYELNY